jgi:DNA invertase Pin-like site-specific DNA recombinase
VKVVWKLDRLGRSVKNLVDLISKLSEQNIHFKNLTDNIDTTSPAGRFFFHIMASLAQMERELNISRFTGCTTSGALGRSQTVND